MNPTRNRSPNPAGTDAPLLAPRAAAWPVGVSLLAQLVEARQRGDAQSQKPPSFWNDAESKNQKPEF